jgi:hypothetical protein
MPGMYEINQPMKREELGDEIFAVESHQTPFLRLVPKGSQPNQMLDSWPVQEYPRQAFGGTVDGYDVDTYNSTTREEIEGACQWILQSWKVAKLANLTVAAGVGRNEKARQMRDALLLLNKKLERLFLSANDLQVAAGETPYETRGALSWLQVAAQTTKPVPADFRPPSACVHATALSNLTPDAFEDLLEAAANKKMAPVDLTGIVGIKLKSHMSYWGQKATVSGDTQVALQNFSLNASDKRLISIVDRFEFDAGTVEVVPSWYLACDPDTGEDTDYTPRSGIFVETAMWEKRFLQNVESVIETPKSGGPRGYHDCVVSLACKNPLGQVMVYTDSDS